MTRVSIIIPAFNEEKRIKKTLRDYTQRFKNTEFIVVSDGTTDRTSDVVRRFSKKVKVIENPVRMGKGWAVITGMKSAKGNIIGFTDADDSTSSKDFEKIIKSMNGSDCAIGSRAVEGSKMLVKQSLQRRFLGIAFRNYCNILLGMKIRDTQCGAKVFKRSSIENLLDGMKIKGFAFDVELLYKIMKNGGEIVEVPIDWRDNKDSKVKIKHVLDMMWSVIKIRFG